MNSNGTHEAESTPANASQLNAATQRVAATDSPWFWLSIFILGALLALLLTAPKYSWRQPQIERQFQARERSGQAVSRYEGYSPLSTPGNALLTLQPLFAFFTIALFASTIVFWWRKLAAARRGRVSERKTVNGANES